MAGINEQQLIYQLRELSKTYAVEALQKPVQKDSFEYGLHCGIVQGLARAEELLLKLLHGEEKSEKQRQRPPSAYTA